MQERRGLGPALRGNRRRGAPVSSTSSHASPTASGVHAGGWRRGYPARTRYTSANR